MQAKTLHLQITLFCLQIFNTSYIMSYRINYPLISTNILTKNH